MRDDFAFTVDELSALREAQTDHMLDQCVVLSYSAGTLNEFNEADAPTYTETGPFWCGLQMGAGSEVKGGEMTVVNWDATLRLPIHTPVKETDRIKIIARFGLDDEFQTYEIVSPIQRGPSGIRIQLRKYTE